MNEHLKQLMLEAGYAAPELASRAQKLAELIIQRCCAIADDVEKSDLPVLASKFIKAHFGVDR